MMYGTVEPDKVITFEGNDDAVLVRDLMYTRERLGNAKATHELAVNQLKDKLRDGELIMFQGEKIASWKADKNGKRTFRVHI
jgi:5S rRNA maturation endonuclease (ribonuclease M5)